MGATYSIDKHNAEVMEAIKTTNDKKIWIDALKIVNNVVKYSHSDYRERVLKAYRRIYAIDKTQDDKFNNKSYHQLKRKYIMDKKYDAQNMRTYTNTCERNHQILCNNDKIINSRIKFN
jgi:hypothetical protein